MSTKVDISLKNFPSLKPNMEKKNQTMQLGQATQVNKVNIKTHNKHMLCFYDFSFKFFFFSSFRALHLTLLFYSIGNLFYIPMHAPTRHNLLYFYPNCRKRHVKFTLANKENIQILTVQQ